VRFKASISDYVDHIFSGRVGGALSDLRDVLTNGQWLEDHVKRAGNLGGLERVMKTGFAATLVANAWKITENIYPVILMENTDCDKGEPSIPLEYVSGKRRKERRRAVGGLLPRRNLGAGTLSDSHLRAAGCGGHNCTQ
jgi:hypothetical protein